MQQEPRTLLDFAVGLAVLYDLGISDAGLKDYAKWMKRKIEPQHVALVCMCISTNKRREFVRQFLRHL